MREGLDSNDIDSREGEPVPLELARALAAPALQATVPDLEFAHTVLVLGCEPLDDAPILDLRIRKGVRRHGVAARDRDRATERARRKRADSSSRYAPGDEAAVPRASSMPRLRAMRPAGQRLRRALARDAAEDGGEDVVIVWGERLAADALAVLCSASPSGSASPDAKAPACSRSRPAPTAAGCARSGRSPTPVPATASCSDAAPGRGATEIARAAAAGEITALYLFQTDPVRDQPDRGAVGARAPSRRACRRPRVGADRRAPRARQRDLPGRVPRREGGHGRSPRRPPPAAARWRSRIPGQVRAGWSVIAEISPSARALGHRRADQPDGVQAAGRGGAVLRRD